MENPNNAKNKKFRQNVTAGEALRPEQHSLLKNLKNDLIFLEYLEYPEVISDTDFHPYNKLDEIKKLPKEEKRGAVTRYKEDLNRQKEGLAELQIELSSKIDENFDVPIEDLVATVDKFKREYNFAGYQTDAIKVCLKRYLERRENIKVLLEKAPNGPVMFEYLYGRRPKGRVEMSRETMFIDLMCYEKEDYVTAFYDCKKEPNKQQMEHGEKSAGLFIKSGPKPNTDDIIVLENLSIGGEVWHKLNVKSHEEQHVLNSLNFLWRDFKKEVANSNIYENFETVSPQQREKMLKDFWRQFIESENIWLNVKDEILAYFKEGRGKSSIWSTLTKSNTEGGIYDYLSDKKIAKFNFGLNSSWVLQH